MSSSAVLQTLVSVPITLPPVPYPGLRPFEATEWAIFFGRERMIEEVRARLVRQRLVVVHGSSGCGKSSLIRAGVLPRLILDHERYGLPSWHTETMRPGGSPLWNLAQAIVALTDAPAEGKARFERVRAVRRILNHGGTALADLAKTFGLGQERNTCLLIDQFEELFRFAREVGRGEAETFIEVLGGFAADPPSGVHAVLTMRSDHLGECGRYLGFAELVNATQYLLPRMNQAALLRAIREPARLYAGEVTLELALRLVEDGAGEADALPLVQHCLMRLWQQARIVALSTPVFPVLSETIAPYQQSDHARPVRQLDLLTYPGLRESLSQHADEILAELEQIDATYPKVAGFLFRALTEIDGRGRAIRRPRTFAELKAETGTESAALGQVINAFRRSDRSFLMPLGDKPLTDDDVVDIGHEALIRCWRKLDDPTMDPVTHRPRGWLQREQEDGRTWRLLLYQAQQFEDHHAEPLGASVLIERETWFQRLPSRQWADRYGGGWESVERLLKASRIAATLEAARVRSAMARRRWLIVVATAAAIMFAVLFGFADWQRDIAEAQRKRLADAQVEQSKVITQLANKEIDRGDAVKGIFLALAALPKLDDLDKPDRPIVKEAVSALERGLIACRELADLQGHQKAIYSAAWNQDGTRLATASQDKTVRVWDVAGVTQVLELPFAGTEDWVRAVAWSPDGTRLATASDDGMARVWGTESRREILQNTELADLAKEVESRLPKGLTIEQKEQRSTVAWQLSTLAFRVAD